MSAGHGVLAMRGPLHGLSCLQTRPLACWHGRAHHRLHRGFTATALDLHHPIACVPRDSGSTAASRSGRGVGGGVTRPCAEPSDAQSQLPRDRALVAEFKVDAALAGRASELLPRALPQLLTTATGAALVACGMGVPHRCNVAWANGCAAAWLHG
eukprot:351140-Chlamydomonas_euryale.AAC.14